MEPWPTGSYKWLLSIFVPSESELLIQNTIHTDADSQVEGQAGHVGIVHLGL